MKMIFNKHINKILKEMSAQNQTPQVSSPIQQQGNETADSLMKRAAILKAQAETLENGSSMDNTRKLVSHSNQAIDAANQKRKQAEQLESRAKAINPNIQQAYSLNVPKGNLPTKKLNKNF